MKEKFTLEQFIKKELQQEEYSFNEGLWSKLDQQLIPVRDAYHKKERRKALIFWLPLGVLLVGSVVGVGVYYNNKSEGLKNCVVEKSTSSKENVKGAENESIITPLNNSGTKQDDIVNNNNNINKVSEDNNLSSLNNTTTNSFSKVDDFALSNNQNTSRNKTKRSGSVKYVTNTTNSVALTEDVVISTSTAKAKKNTAVDASPVTSEEIQPVAVAKADEPTTKLTVADKKETKTDISNAKKKKENTTTPMEYYALGGVNFSSPFRKGGYFAGILLEKQIKDKRLFFGVKVAYNNLNHQLVATKNATVFPQTTDAMINKMTTIQVPFGYQFKLSKGAAAKATILNVGFEPTLITGIQTIYYDDNGVPGGPRTAVVNSPLLSNAINKFNVSFIAGVRKQLTNKIGFNVNAGYGLIDITDKQYYNKTSSNNNLKYIQLGLHYKLR